MEERSRDFHAVRADRLHIFPLIPILAGMALGGGTSAGLQLANKGKVDDWGSVGLGALGGAAGGGVGGALLGTGAGAASGSTIGAETGAGTGAASGASSGSLLGGASSAAPSLAAGEGGAFNSVLANQALMNSMQAGTPMAAELTGSLNPAIQQIGLQDAAMAAGEGSSQLPGVVGGTQSTPFEAMKYAKLVNQGLRAGRVMGQPEEQPMQAPAPPPRRRMAYRPLPPMATMSGRRSLLGGR